MGLCPNCGGVGTVLVNRVGEAPKGGVCLTCGTVYSNRALRSLIAPAGIT